jgi:hypothetical protein
MMNYDELKKYLKEDKFRWSKHALEKCDIYGFDEENVIKEVIESGELVEYHYWYGYGDKFLVFVNSDVNGIYHVVVINNEISDLIILKTVYKPDERFKQDNKTRTDPSNLL